MGPLAYFSYLVKNISIPEIWNFGRVFQAWKVSPLLAGANAALHPGPVIAAKLLNGEEPCFRWLDHSLLLSKKVPDMVKNEYGRRVRMTLLNT